MPATNFTNELPTHKGDSLPVFPLAANFAEGPLFPRQLLREPFLALIKTK